MSICFCLALLRVASALLGPCFGLVCFCVALFAVDWLCWVLFDLAKTCLALFVSSYLCLGLAWLLRCVPSSLPLLACLPVRLLGPAWSWLVFLGLDGLAWPCLALALPYLAWACLSSSNYFGARLFSCTVWARLLACLAAWSCLAFLRISWPCLRFVFPCLVLLGLAWFPFA